MIFRSVPRLIVMDTSYQLDFMRKYGFYLYFAKPMEFKNINRLVKIDILESI